jgi:hypothetical protein
MLNKLFQLLQLVKLSTLESKKKMLWTWLLLLTRTLCPKNVSPPACRASSVRHFNPRACCVCGRTSTTASTPAFGLSLPATHVMVQQKCRVNTTFSATTVTCVLTLTLTITNKLLEPAKKRQADIQTDVNALENCIKETALAKGEETCECENCHGTANKMVYWAQASEWLCEACLWECVEPGCDYCHKQSSCYDETTQSFACPRCSVFRLHLNHTTLEELSSDSD